MKFLFVIQLLLPFMFDLPFVLVVINCADVDTHSSETHMSTPLLSPSSLYFVRSLLSPIYLSTSLYLVRFFKYS